MRRKGPCILKRWVLFIMLFCVFGSVTAWAFLPLEGGARSMALGESSATLVDDPWTMVNNPGGIASPQARPGIVALRTNKLQIPGYDLHVLGCQLPRAFGFGLGIMGAEEKSPLYAEEGSNALAERRLGLAIGRQFGNLGLGVSYWSYSQVATIGNQEMTTLEGTSLDAGATLRINPKLQLGIVAKNLVSDLPEEDLVPVYGLGVSYKPWQALQLYFNLEGIPSYDTGLFEFNKACGLELQLLNFVALRAGVATDGSISAGVGIQLGRLQVDYAQRLLGEGQTMYLSSQLSF